MTAEPSASRDHDINPDHFPAAGKMVTYPEEPMSDLEKTFGLDKIPPPVDRDARTLTDGSPVTPDHRDIQPSGQQKAYVVLSADERAKGFVRPVRRSYIHDKCGTTTTMGGALAETYARDPYFYAGTFCCECGAHFPVGEDGEFTWADGSGEKVGA